MSVDISKMVGKMVLIEANTGEDNLAGRARYAGKNSQGEHQFLHMGKGEDITELLVNSVGNRDETLVLEVIDYNVHKPGNLDYDPMNRMYRNGLGGVIL